LFKANENISAAEKEMIWHANAERLLGLAPQSIVG
jgi:hypothetical protein